MSNVLISNLPTYSGNTDGVFVVMNDSTNTTTYKVTKETLVGASGTSGTSGTSGSSGTSGTTGTSGTSGTSGNSGSSGTTGTSGTSGTSVAVSGTTNTLPKFTSSTTIGNSAITDDGTTVTLVNRALSGSTATFSASAKATTGFNSFTDTIGVANVTWVTIYTIPASQAAEGVYNVYAHYNDDSGGMAFTQILADRTHLREINNSDGATVLIQLSGRNIQVQHSYGTTVNIDWSILIQKLR